MRLALFEPDIPQNAGTLLRLAACLGVGVDVIEPAGFLWDDRKLRRAGMDYLDRVEIVRHPDWQRFRAAARGRLVLLSTRAPTVYTEFAFAASDILVAGRESAGVPDWMPAAVDGAVRVPMVAGVRSLNVAVATAMVLGEALRQTGGFTPPGGRRESAG